MNLTSAFAPGDKGWVFRGDRVKQLTVGLVRVQVVSSNGTGEWAGERLGGIVLNDGENYAPMQSRKEEYMCVETGIGSGSVYTLGEHIFETEEACRTVMAEWIAKVERDAADKKLYERRCLLERESRVRAEPAKAEPLTYPQARAAFEAWANKAHYDPSDGELRDAFLAGIEFIEGPEPEAA